MKTNTIKILIVGANILQGSRTGGMYFTHKVYQAFLNKPDMHIDTFELRDNLKLMKYRLLSLYMIFACNKKYDYVVIDGAIYQFLYLLFAKLRGAKAVCLYYHFLSKERHGLRKLLFKFKEMILVKLVDKSIFISQSTYNDAVSLGFKGADFLIINPGIDKRIWMDRTKEYSPNCNEFNIIFVGHVLKKKGVLELLSAFSGFIDSIDDEAQRAEIHLDIVGNDSADVLFTQEIRDFIINENLSENVTLRGRVSLDKLIDLYKLATVFMLPSYYEGFGIVVVEAASFGIPLIVSDGGSLPEVVNFGEYGSVCNVGEVSSLKKEISLLYYDRNRRQSMSQKAATLYAQAITWEECTGKIYDYLTGH